MREDAHRAAHDNVDGMSHPYFAVSGETPLVLGHRGAAGEAPENTLLSFELAWKQRADILESDVHLTRDGVPVLFHDPLLDRTTDATGPLCDRTLAELRELDAAYHFSLDGGASFPLRGRGVRIPTLEEAFAAFPDAPFNLELKQGGESLAQQAVARVAEADRHDRTLLTAGDDEQMDHLKTMMAAADPRPALGASTLDIAGFVRAAVEEKPPPIGPEALQIPTEFAGQPLVTQKLISHAHAHDVQIHVWTIDREEEMTRLLDMGVDGLVTNFPARMRELVVRRGDRD